MEKELGYFDTENREYVITNMHPRRPLKNYLWNEKVVAFYDQFGCGNATANTLTQLRPMALENRMVYVKDNKTGKYYSPNKNFIWNCQHGVLSLYCGSYTTKKAPLSECFNFMLLFMELSLQMCM